METNFETRRNDRKEKAKKLSLQWVFSGAGQREVSNCYSTRTISDKRIAGVCAGQDYKNSRAGTDGIRPGNNGDGLLGSLLLEQFLGAVLCPLLPSFLGGIDIVNTIEMADEFWMDRRTARSGDNYPEMTYFPA